MPISGYFDVVFASGGDLNTIPDATQPSGTVSYTQGFPVGYSTPVSSGGFNVPRTAINQALNDVTKAIQNWQQNTVAPFITTTMNGGTAYSYPANAIVLSGGIVYISLVGSNTTTPPSSSWAPLYIFNAATESVTGASHTYATTDANQQVIRSNSGTLMTDTLPGTSPGVLAKGWYATIQNNDASALLFFNTGAGANLNGSSTGSIVLGPGQRCTVFSDGSNYWTRDLPLRVRLGANTTFYVATTGNDSNNGLASGAAWLTLQHAVNYIIDNVDLAGFTATISVADGTYTSGITISGPFIGEGTVILLGDTTTPANCIISTTNADCIQLNGGVSLSVEGFKLQTTTSGSCINCLGSTVNIAGNMNFGTSANYHIVIADGGHAVLNSNYTVSGSCLAHFFAQTTGAIIGGSTTTVTISGSPAWTTAFAYARLCGVMDVPSISFSGGTPTGPRYSAVLNGAINTSGGGASYFPGGTAGSTATGGQYA